MNFLYEKAKEIVEAAPKNPGPAVIDKVKQMIPGDGLATLMGVLLVVALVGFLMLLHALFGGRR